MSKIEIEIENGYGIEYLKQGFVFDGNTDYPQQDTNIIYAQNGTMKSSFAKVLYDYSKGKDIKDYIFDIDGTCYVRDELGSEFPRDRVFSVASFDNGNFESKKTAALLVNADLKARYEVHMDKFNAALTILLERIKSVSGVGVKTGGQQIIDAICAEYGSEVAKTPLGLMSVIRSNRKEIEARPEYIQQIPYSVIGTKDAQKFAEDNRGFIQELMDVYDQVKQTAAFVRGDFDSGSARKFIETVEKTDFLGVDHEIELLNITTGKLEKVSTIEELQGKLATDIDRILAEKPGLKKKFEKMISDLSTASRYSLKKVLENEKTKDVILLMNNPPMFKRSLWEGYLKGCLDEVDQLAKVQEEIQAPIEAIIKEAEDESTQWDEVVGKFNHRFRNLPYDIDIKDKASVMLEGIVEPQAIIRYKHPKRKSREFISDQEKQGIVSRLSTGERKALYLLNVMFEIEASEKTGEDHLVVLDDIVDSFDYKNKYAFLEYIYEVSKTYKYIKLIVLTHNYDFFRLLQSRLFGEKLRSHSWFALRGESNIQLVQAEHFRVFTYMREHAETDKKMWLSMIPFARNLAEYKCNDLTKSASYNLLTKCLHSLDAGLKVADVRPILKQEVDIDNSPFEDKDKIEDALLSQAKLIAKSPPKGINLHDNLILAMACRWLAENYMKTKLSSTEIDSAKAAGSVFTRELFNLIYEKNVESREVIELLDEVNLITPEHIHVNSFMYEPLLDISFDELKGLYADLTKLV